MEKSKARFWMLILLSGVLFEVLFYEHAMGLNVLVFTLFLLLAGTLTVNTPPTPVFYLIATGFLVSAIGVVLGHSGYSMIIYWACCLVYAGHVSYPFIRHLHYSPVVLLQGVLAVPVTFRNLTASAKRTRMTRHSSYLSFVAVPLVTVAVLLFIYYQSSTFFASSFDHLIDSLGRVVGLRYMGSVPFFIGGALIPVLFLVKERLIPSEQTLGMNLIRKRAGNKGPAHLSRFILRKKQVAIALFLLLNMMIAWLNWLDIRHYWFGFNWDGGYLKEMVHEGANLLIIAILISIAISLYYLNSNIVFLGSNRLVHGTILLWLLQNMIMIVSVGIRNMHYIHYFALAYKRIFVFFFLAACTVGLASIIYQIYRRRSSGFLLSVNAVSVYVLLVLAGCFNWDGIIARYNFSHAREAFIHYRFLAGLNDAALPYLVTDRDKLMQIDAEQVKRFRFCQPRVYDDEKFSEEIEKRKIYFRQAWEEKTWLDWNYPEGKAYGMITNMNAWSTLH